MTGEGLFHGNRSMLWMSGLISLSALIQIRAIAPPES
jgi:hypothetical protein